MEINGGQTLTGMTDNPSSIEILGDTTFTAHWGGPSAVVYLPGNHGSFASHSKDPGSQTLYTDLPFGAMGDQYAYRGPTAPRPAAGPGRLDLHWLGAHRLR